MRVLSMDIGLHNLAFIVEDYNQESLKKVKLLQKNKRYNENKEANDDFKENLNQIYKIGEIIYFDKKDIIKEKKKFVDEITLVKLTEYLESLVCLFDTCDLFLIEKQLDSKKVKNNIAKRIEHHIHSFLLITYKNFINKSKFIFIYSSVNKTKLLGAPYKINNKKITKYQRKKWSVEKAKDLLFLRNNTILYEYIFKYTNKKDDICDCIMQLQSFKLYCIDNKINYNINKEECYTNDIINKIIKKNICKFNHIYWGETCFKCLENINNNQKIINLNNYLHKFNSKCISTFFIEDSNKITIECSHKKFFEIPFNKIYEKIKNINWCKCEKNKILNIINLNEDEEKEINIEFIE